MLRLTVLFVLGNLAFHQCTRVPSWPLALALVVFLLLVIARGRGRAAWLGLPAGFLCAHVYALMHVPAHLPDEQGPLRGVVEGQVASLVRVAPASARFELLADRVTVGDQVLEGEWRVRLHWRDPPTLVPGQRWRLGVRLRHVHGYASPGAWDFEGWAYHRGMRYSGYVDPRVPPEMLGEAACCGLDRWRSRVVAAIEALTLSAFARGVLTALTVGDHGALDASARDLFRDTGTSHLMAISGLHIGLVAGLGLFVVAGIWRRVPRLVARIPAQQAGAVFGLAAAAAYALLAGLSLPTQRALIMLIVFAGALLLRRRSDRLSALAAAAVGVLLWHPPSILAAGFWLSFAAVLVILAQLNGAATGARWRTALRLQLAVSLALWPVLSVFGLPAAVAAPAANLLLVPLFSLLVVPVSLLGLLLLWAVPRAGRWVLETLGQLLDGIEVVLQHLLDLPWPALEPPTDAWSLAALSLAVLLYLAPSGFPLRMLGFPLMLAAWLPLDTPLATGEFELHVLDVGQGLSAVVETQHHLLVFDSGPEFASGFAASEAVLLPFLRTRGRRHIDRLVVSHGDSDHAGGVGRLLDALPAGLLLSGEPQRVGFAARQCVAGESWKWDGVRFSFLHPAVDARFEGNDASCVLRVDNGGRSVLLTGDIEARVEARLVAADAAALASDIVVAPHHGSRSSSSPGFVAAAHPGYVVYTAGWANRYGFPRADVDRRWADVGALRMNTATTGTIRFRVGDISAPIAVNCYRPSRRRFWHHDAGSADACHAVSSSNR